MRELPGREQSATIQAWMRRDLSHRYSRVLREELPPDMLQLLADKSGQN